MPNVESVMQASLWPLQEMRTEILMADTNDDDMATTQVLGDVNCLAPSRVSVCSDMTPAKCKGCIAPAPDLQSMQRA